MNVSRETIKALITGLLDGGGEENRKPLVEVSQNRKNRKNRKIAAFAGFRKEYKRIKNVSVVPKVDPKNVALGPIIGTDILI